jgi:hypothetical protein
VIESELERFTDGFERALRGVGRRERRRAIREARDHVLCAAEDQQSQGASRADALQHAIVAFGAVDQIAASYRAPRSRARMATATGLVLAAAAFATLTVAPTSIISTSHAAAANTSSPRTRAAEHGACRSAAPTRSRSPVARHDHRYCAMHSIVCSCSRPPPSR